MKVPHQLELKVPYRRFGITFKRRVGFLFDEYAWFLSYRMGGDELEDLSKKTPTQLVFDMVYYACISYHKEVGKRVWFDKKDVVIWMKKLPHEDVERLSAEYIESLNMFNKVKDDISKDDTTKKK